MMTEEEKRKARNEASRRCYLKRKAALAAQKGKAGKTKPAARLKAAASAPKTKIKPKTAIALFKPAKKADPLAAVEKLVKKYGKTPKLVKNLVKDAAKVFAEIYKTRDLKLIEKAKKVASSKLGILAGPATVNGKTKCLVTLATSSCAALPKGYPFEDPTPAVQTACPETEPADPEEDEEQTEIPVDPAKLGEISERSESGDVPSVADIAEQDGEDEDEDESDDEDETDEDEDDRDDDELTDEEREERRQREESALDRDYAAGRAEAMRELGAQGWGEED